MHRAIVVASGVVMLGVGAATLPSTTLQQRGTARVQVHCPAGNNGAFVTPARVQIAVGDTVEWRTTGQVVSDSIVITLKDPSQAWPFAGNPSRGGGSARADAARTPGTYSYNVRLLCRMPGGTQVVDIDPDIIIL